jgi:hypothetical protein
MESQEAYVHRQNLILFKKQLADPRITHEQRQMLLGRLAEEAALSRRTRDGKSQNGRARRRIASRLELAGKSRTREIVMKISRILPVAGILTLLACGAAFAQSPPIPPGAGVGVDRQPPGSRWRDSNPPPAAAQPAATSADKRAISLRCSQQADAKGLQGRGREAFRSRCELAKGKAQ